MELLCYWDTQEAKDIAKMPGTCGIQKVCGPVEHAFNTLIKSMIDIISIAILKKYYTAPFLWCLLFPYPKDLASKDPTNLPSTLTHSIITFSIEDHQLRL